MKTYTMVSVFLGVMCITAPAEKEFQALREDYAAKAAVVESLRKLVVKEIEFKDATIGEVLGGLNKKLDHTRWSGVNVVVRMPRVEGRGEDPFAAEDYQPWKPRRVTMKAKSIDFASAVDRACKLAGFRWSIDFRERTKVPIVVVEADHSNR